MTDINHCPPLSGPASDPVLYGVAQGLAHLFPPIGGPSGGCEHIEGQTGSDAAEIDPVKKAALHVLRDHRPVAS